MKNKFLNNFFLSIIIIIILFFSLKKTINEKYEKQLIKSNPVLTIGKITKYTEIGISNYYLTYEYEVKEKKYHKKIMPNFLFKNCQHDNKCIGKKIYIKYYANDCSISEPIFNKFPEE